MEFIDKQIAPPKSWEKFEDLTRALFAAIWSNPFTQKNGRSGQAQNGVDVYGEPAEDPGSWYGVQCKGKDAAYGSKASIEEFDTELKKAEKFTPALGKWFFVTTSPNDAVLQEHARKISKHRMEVGKFPVEFIGWNTFLGLLSGQEGVLREFYAEHVPSIRDELALIKRQSRSALDSIEDVLRHGDIGLSLVRQTEWADARKALSDHSIIRLTGDGGAGKSGILRRLGEAFGGPIIVLKDNQISALNLQQHFAQLGVTATPEAILEQFVREEDALCLIDGADRLLLSDRRTVVIELLKSIYSSPHAARWKIVTSARTFQNRDLVASAFKEAGIADHGIAIEIGAISDGDARMLGETFPQYSSLLKRKDLAGQNRSLFLLGELFKRDTAPSQMLTEIDVAGAWAGADANGLITYANRSRALSELGAKLVEAPTRRPGRADLDPVGLSALLEEGTVLVVPNRDTIALTHDVHEDWLIARSLERLGDRLPQSLIEASEPLWWQRAVRLVGQMLLETNQAESWASRWALLDQSKTLDPAWARALLIAPLYSERSSEILPQLESTLLADGAALLKRLLETLIVLETRIDERVLASAAMAHLSETERYTLAAYWKIPLLQSWASFLAWALPHCKKWPPAIIPQMSEIFFVFARHMANVPNGYSERIATICIDWLVEIEDARRPENWNDRREPFGHDLGDYDGWQKIGKRLRQALALSVESASGVVTAYLTRLTSARRHLDDARNELIETPYRIPHILPRQWADMCLAHFVPRRRRIRHGPESIIPGQLFSWHDYQHAGIEGDQGFFPSSPLRAGFADLFEADESEALRLFHRLEMRASVFWRRYSKCHDGRRPRPVVFQFPWGGIQLWGDEAVYRWSRGLLGSHVLGSAYLALDAWMSKQAANGRPIDELLRLVLRNNGLIATAMPCLALLTERSNSPGAIDYSGPFLAEPRLWKHDIHRHMDDQGFAHRIGFWSGDNIHYQAVEELHERHNKQQPMSHALLLPFRLMGSVASQEAFNARRTLWSASDFADFDDELDNPSLMKEFEDRILRSLSDSDPAQIVFESVPAQNQIKVSIAPPKEAEAEIQAFSENQRHFANASRLNLWAEKTREAGEIAASMTLEEAIELTKILSELPAQSNGPQVAFSLRMRAAAMVGAAAVVARFGSDETLATNRDWITDYLLSGARLNRSDPELDIMVDSAILSFDPQVFAAWGLAALCCRKEHTPQLDGEVLALTVQRLQAVTSAVIDGLIWEDRPEFARAVYIAALDSCVIDVGHWWRADNEKRHALKRTEVLRRQAIRRALHHYPHDRAPILPPSPYSWQWIWTGKWPKLFSRVNMRSKRVLDWDRAGSILKKARWQNLCYGHKTEEVFSKYLSSLVTWTRAYSEENESRHDNRYPYEWGRDLARVIGSFAAAFGKGEDWCVLRSFTYHDRASDLVGDYLDAVTHELVASRRKPDERFWTAWKPAAKWVMEHSNPKKKRHGFGSLSNDLLAAGFVGPYLTPIPTDWPYLDDLLDWIDGWAKATSHLPQAVFQLLSIVERMNSAQRSAWFLPWLKILVDANGSDESFWNYNGLGNKAAALMKPLSTELGANHLMARQCLAVIADSGSTVARELLVLFATRRPD